MPLINITLPEDALTEPQQAELAKQAADILLTLEGMATNPKARRLTWSYIQTHPKNAFYIGGEPMQAHPHYLFDVTVFANTLTAEKKEILTRKLTGAVLDLEDSDHNMFNAARVWVMIHEVEEGNWGGAGQIYSMANLRKLLS
ncbi:tautomerase family protein [Hydrogenovibrio kuenenii]|uniref:tautomerase family protein n=1 Tax=Hydrogenovibrio kuenenii TaxID=63658 RepID=UPI0004662BE7|nr:tautomerase family protein [Hydrogenovibrio kuenenii]